MATTEKTKAVAVITIPKDIVEMASKATNITIKTPDDMLQASAMRELLKKRLKAVEKDRDEILNPQKEAVMAIRAKYKPLETKIEDALITLNDMMIKYQTKVRQAELAEEEAIANRIGSGKGKLSAETAMAKIDNMKRADNKVSTGAGSTGFVTTPCFALEDIKLVPVDCVLLNEVKVRKLMLAGVKVKGIKYWTEERPRSGK